MKSNLFLALLPNHVDCQLLTQKLTNYEANLLSPMEVQWVHEHDLHITLGYIHSVKKIDYSHIANCFSNIAFYAAFVASTTSIKLYGNAITLSLTPLQPFVELHKEMKQKLIEGTQNQYRFDTHKGYEPHITIGKIRNLAKHQCTQKQTLIQRLQPIFQSTNLRIQQAALLHRVREGPLVPVYQALQVYRFKGAQLDSGLFY